MDLRNSLIENEGQAPIWLMPTGGRASKPLDARDRGQSNSDRDACQASVLEILESQIIPSLLKSTAHSLPFISTDGTRRTLPTKQEIANFAEICISTDPDLSDTFVQGLMAEGLRTYLARLKQRLFCLSNEQDFLFGGQVDELAT